jgi:hypothetical protein
MIFFRESRILPTLDPSSFIFFRGFKSEFGCEVGSFVSSQFFKVINKGSGGRPGNSIYFDEFDAVDPICWTLLS